jgi:hypothetical protein
MAIKNITEIKNKPPLESQEQKIIFSWIRANQIKHPKLQLAYGTLNGVRLAPRLRAEMKKQGNRSGVPDIVLPARSGCGTWPGLYIELKRAQGGQISANQKRYHALLLEQGYRCLVCRGHAEAIEAIKNYLAGWTCPTCAGSGLDGGDVCVDCAGSGEWDGGEE